MDLEVHVGDSVPGFKTPFFVQCPRTCGLCGPQRERVQRERLPHSTLVADLLRGPCEAGWKYADGACFILQHVALGDWMDRAPSRTWPEAERACNNLGAHLATVETYLQNLLVYDLIRQRPAHLVHNTDAWIGLRRNRLAKCSEEAGPWTWVAAEDAAESQYLDRDFYRGRSGECEEGLVSPTYVAVSHTMEYGSLWIRTEPSSERRAWVCSKPARFRDITSGSCADHGL
eukprot:CAMPEP_0179199582 /NCGR_PEP_ID=MMETSP0796-20121207/99299_1 /TAXON_ID=73915 /ORGANISM="Pyrodinium bahamense, Strain pbaha01" /LENGTH=229 /DNA_ID=CAMNT_0020904087 /DNA_START=11 /DNA_END=697 /DNA_ORIENTATION=+